MPGEEGLPVEGGVQVKGRPGDGGPDGLPGLPGQPGLPGFSGATNEHLEMLDSYLPSSWLYNCKYNCNK